MSERRTPGIWATAVGTFRVLRRVWHTARRVCAGVVGLAFAMSWPPAVLVILGYALLFGSRFGLAVGVLVGVAFVLLVGIGECRGAQADVAAAMPWVAVVISDAATAVLFIGWSTGPFTILAEAFSTALALFGGSRIAPRTCAPRSRESGSSYTDRPCRRVCLQGCRVVDLGHDPSARAARVLGDLGASVTRVVSPTGDVLTGNVGASVERGQARGRARRKRSRLDALLPTPTSCSTRPARRARISSTRARTGRGVGQHHSVRARRPALAWRATDLGVMAASATCTAPAIPTARPCGAPSRRATRTAGPRPRTRR